MGYPKTERQHIPPWVQQDPQERYFQAAYEHEVMRREVLEKLRMLEDRVRLRREERVKEEIEETRRREAAEREAVLVRTLKWAEEDRGFVEERRILESSQGMLKPPPAPGIPGHLVCLCFAQQLTTAHVCV